MWPTLIMLLVVAAPTPELSAVRTATAAGPLPTVSSAPPLTPPPPPAPEAEPPKWWPWVVLGAAVVGVATASAILLTPSERALPPGTLDPLRLE